MKTRNRSSKQKSNRLFQAKWFIIISGVLLTLLFSQHFIATTSASQLTQRITNTETPDMPGVSKLLFAMSNEPTSSTATQTMLASLQRPVLDSLPSLNLPVPDNAITSIGQPIGATAASCEIGGLNSAPHGPWVVVELSCGDDGGVVQVNNLQTGESKSVGASVGPNTIFLGWSMV